MGWFGRVTLTSQFRPFARHIRRYFHAYGGWFGVLGSPLFLVSVLIAAASYGKWLRPDWTASTYALVPNLLGFSLGTYALLFSLITARVKGAMRAVRSGGQVSSLEQVNATFFHFIFVQVIALIWAFAFDATALADAANALKAARPDVWDGFVFLRAAGSFVGYVLLIYSVALAVGAALAIYRLALISDPGENQAPD